MGTDFANKPLGSSMFSLKKIVDIKLPKISRSYRQLRDYFRFRRLKPYPTSFGFQLYGDRDLAISRSDAGEVETFMRHARQVDAVIDAGANVGFYTCLAASANLRVLAIEPNAYNLQSLYQNLHLNHLTEVEVYPVALSHQPSVSPLFGGGQGATLLQAWGGIQSNYQRLTPVNTLDNLICDRFQREKLLIKVDVEGNEFHLLEGAKRLLAKVPAPTWIIEHGLTENFPGSCNPHFEAVFKLFWRFQYQAFAVGRENRPISVEDVHRWMRNKTTEFGNINYIFIR
jgi:FkbM family methyltransferase